MISEQQAVAMIDPRNLDTLLHPQFDPAGPEGPEPVGKALPASPGAACGKIVFTAEDAKEWAARGEKVVLVRLETSPEDIEGMKAAPGHPDRPRRHDLSRRRCGPRHGQAAASPAAATSRWTRQNKQFTLAGKTYHEGDWLSLDGSTGNIYDGAIPTVDASVAATSAASWPGPTSSAA